jgi:hypothetical protein
MRILLFFVLAASMGAGFLFAPSAVAGAPSSVKPRQDLVLLLRPHRVYPTAHHHPSKKGVIRARRPITGEPTVLPVIGRVTRADGIHWLRVMLPGRPNGAKGWIVKHATLARTTGWHIVVRTSRRRVVVYRHGRRIRAFSAVVGKPSTPTPHGRFFVEESVRMPAGAPGGPFALATSARSNVLRRFEGGPGQIAIHGRANLGGTLGTAESHGCVRVANRRIRWLVARISPGVVVDIT